MFTPTLKLDMWIHSGAFPEAPSGLQTHFVNELSWQMGCAYLYMLLQTCVEVQLRKHDLLQRESTLHVVSAELDYHSERMEHLPC